MCIYTKKIKLPLELREILAYLQEEGFKAVLVGGCVRDFFLKLPIKDYDIEVFNIKDYDTLVKKLEKFGKINLVGKSFGILKLQTKNHEFDFSLPRLETKIGLGHKGFDVEINPQLSFKEASLRRDFTINALGYDYNTDEILDYHNGLNDLKTKTLKHINEKTFVEDPLRVYRAIQFCARFEFNLDEKTFLLCKTLVDNNALEELPKERIYDEFKKLFLKAAKPSLGFTLLKDLGILKYYEELEALISCPQDEEYHPEGNVWIHTLMTLDEMSKLKTGNNKRDLMLFLSLLCHDLGKPFCTKEINGHITSYKHETLGLKPTISFLNKLLDDKKLIEEVCLMVKYHLLPFAFFKQKPSLKAIKRLSTKVNIENLCLVCLADCLGRDIKDKEKCPQAIAYLLNEAKKLDIHNEPLKKLVLGRDLLRLAFKPGKTFKTILDFAYDLQIDENKNKEEILLEIQKKFKV